ncbi:MAG: HU family DNA-binding protein [Bacteroidaceae bacterium]|nr:HU family DNA-binding protein [Bacteroidaceae bacterium]
MIKYNIIPRKNPINKEVKYYAQMAPVTPVTLNSIAEAIASNCTVTLHDCKAVLSALQEQIALNLRQGNSVRLGDLGSFHSVIKSSGALSADEFSTSHIKGLKVCFCMSSPMRYMLSKQNPSVTFQVMRPEEDEEDEGV